MTCDEIEALRLGLMNTLGTADRTTREHAERELGDDVSGPIAALAEAGTISEIQRHLDAALVDLEAEIAEADSDTDEYDYMRGRLVAVRDAEQAIQRLTDQGESLLDGFGETHHLLHEAFPVEDA